MNKHILLIDPDTALTHQLVHYFQLEQFTTSTVDSGESGIKRALNQSFDMIILDLIIQKPNGFTVLKTIRASVDTPILILSAREDDIDKLLALEMGADDYLHKPCSANELLLRMRALMSRVEKKPQHRATLSYLDITVDCAKRCVNLAGNAIELTHTEFNILEILIKSPGQAFSKEELTEYALDRKHSAYDRSIDVHISNLRSKLGNNSAGETWIKTIRGFGYLLSA